MSSLSWWRSWHGAPMDHKWAVIAARSGVKAGIVSAIAWALLDYASQHKDRGSIEGFDTEEYSVFSGFSEQEITAVILAMTEKGIIKNGRFANWEKRQPKREDDSYDRVTRFREKKRNVTQSNAPEKERDTDTESDTDIDKETEKSAPAWIDPFEQMVNLIQGKTGYPPVGGDIQVINEFISRGVIESDIDDAMHFLDGKKQVRGAQDLERSVYVSMAKRIQGSNGHKPEEYTGAHGEKLTL
jgi:hypothetical protein